MRRKSETLSSLLADIRACRLCAAHLPHGTRPVLRISQTAKLLVAGQAPGLRVHESGVPYSDRSGERLRAWMGVDHDVFYDESLVAIVPMGFCFPGYGASGSDLPPRRECVRTWHDRLFATVQKFELVLAIGAYAHRYHLEGRARKTVGETVRAWRDYGRVVPLPHPSWRNNSWLRQNPWFESELVPYLRQSVNAALFSARSSLRASR
jgi:uracil-DNA glycosylase